MAYVGASATTGTITATATGDTAIAASTVTLVGTYVPATGQVTWVCGGTIAAKYMPSSCR
ncbi:pilin [Methylibium sp.]|uniref:pilin n=1 Tax=Methylibium sp. TaxID=2067992 RepID=UPI0038F5FD5E